jgi:hydrogenase/urease accessory protein HupE
VAGPLFRLGIQHILTGYDHLLFLLGLTLVGGRLRPLLVMVTAFTVAHSITLGLAALDVWAPGPRVVEPAIALSICYVGIENWFVRDVRRRWVITAPFGLVHGFGFAGALKEISLPTVDVPLALASFNLGVEAGQLAVLAVILPLVLWLGRRRWFPEAGVKTVSAAIAVAGLCWFVRRLAT